MTFKAPCLHSWDAPSSHEIGKTVEEFLEILRGPTWLRLPGRDRSRSRAISTLLHGNEPSGIRALFHFIQSGQQPAVDLVCFVGAVDAALTPPGFAHRNLPGHKDLNRCFREPFNGPEGSIAEEVIKRFRQAKPEALIDLHNTSGSSPAYGVATQLGVAQKTLTSLFSNHLILTDLRLGTLMEATEFDFPTITVECGGARDSHSERVALEGLTQYAESKSVIDLRPKYDTVSVFRHPVRVELREGSNVAYGTGPLSEANLTLRHDADRFNFGVLNPGEILGWLGANPLEVLSARDSAGQDRTREIFQEKSGCLVISQAGHILMMTTDPFIARSDCLFYWIPVNEKEESVLNAI